MRCQFWHIVQQNYICETMLIAKTLFLDLFTSLWSASGRINVTICLTLISVAPIKFFDKGNLGKGALFAHSPKLKLIIGAFQFRDLRQLWCFIEVWKWRGRSYLCKLCPTSFLWFTHSVHNSGNGATCFYTRSSPSVNVIQIISHRCKHRPNWSGPTFIETLSWVILDFFKLAKLSHQF